MQKVRFEDLLQQPYKSCWDYQETLFSANIEAKIEARKNPDLTLETKHHLLFVEHTPVYTLGKSGKFEHLLLNEAELDAKNIDYYKINRGGDITFHGPGQLVGYPILDLELFFTDIHRYMRTLEQVIIDTIAHFGIVGERFEGYTGVWIKPGVVGEERKICAMGVRCSRWVTMHGWALNVNTDLNYFNNIVPCGIEGKDVTSIAREIGQSVDFEEVKHVCKSAFEKNFGCELEL